MSPIAQEERSSHELGPEVDGRARADRVIIRRQPGARRRLAGRVQLLEEAPAGVELGCGSVIGERLHGIDAVEAVAPVAVGVEAALIHQAVDEIDGAVFAEERGVEGYLGDALRYRLAGLRHAVAAQRID